MKIELPLGGKAPKKQKVEKIVVKQDSNNRIRWRKRGNYICATIKGQYVSIDLDSYTIILPNGFKITTKSVEAAKVKAKDFLGYKD